MTDPKVLTQVLAQFRQSLQRATAATAECYEAVAQLSADAERAGLTEFGGDKLVATLSNVKTMLGNFEVAINAAHAKRDATIAATDEDDVQES